MRASVCSTLTLLTIAACGSDGTHHESFPSPFGDPGNNVVCGPGTYLAGQQCLPDQHSLDAGLDAGGDGDFGLVDAGITPGTPDSGGGSQDAGREIPDAGGEIQDAGREIQDAGSEIPDAGSSIDVDVTTACLGGGNKFVIAGEDYIHSGPALTLGSGEQWQVLPGQWVESVPSSLRVEISHDLVYWDIELKTNSAQALAVGEYADAQRSPFADPGHPGLQVTGESRGCNTLTGKFTVLELNSAGAADAGMEHDAGPPTLHSFTATFEQHCEGGSAFNVGCIHVEAP